MKKPHVATLREKRLLWLTTNAMHAVSSEADVTAARNIQLKQLKSVPSLPAITRGCTAAVLSISYIIILHTYSQSYVDLGLHINFLVTVHYD